MLAGSITRARERMLGGKLMVAAVLALVGCVVGQPQASMGVPIELVSPSVARLLDHATAARHAFRLFSSGHRSPGRRTVHVATRAETCHLHSAQLAVALHLCSLCNRASWPSRQVSCQADRSCVHHRTPATQTTSKKSFASSTTVSSTSSSTFALTTTTTTGAWLEASTCPTRPSLIRSDL